MHKKEFAEMDRNASMKHSKWMESLNLVPNGTKGFSQMLHGTLQARDALG